MRELSMSIYHGERFLKVILGFSPRNYSAFLKIPLHNVLNESAYIIEEKGTSLKISGCTFCFLFCWNDRTFVFFVNEVFNILGLKNFHQCLD